jgi:starch-binding outer membrane protein, SusD/RagB family
MITHQPGNRIMTTFQLRSVRRIARALLLAPLLVVGQTCTELTETPHDALTEIKSEQEVLAGVVSVYAQLRPTEWVGYITLQDLTTDVSIVPIRGSDWNDNGQWLDLHRQTYTSNSSGTLAFLNGAWNDSFSGIAKANLMIDVVTKAGGATAPRTLAELRALRAWYYYMLQDLFGGAPPLVKQHEDKPQQYPSSTRAELFQFIETELLESRDALPPQWDAAGYGRMTRGAANAILASLYLNAGVFSKNTGINPTSYNSCAGIQVSGGKNACQAAIDAANAVINEPFYALEVPWAKNFSRDNHTSRENIFVIVYTGEGAQGLGGNWPFRTLHYNQLTSGWGGPWNGFATLAETYQQFEPTDERRGMWLVGQASSFETNQPVTDRTGKPLVFTPEIPDAEKADEAHGVRFNKFPPVPSANTGNGMPNDFPYFRLAEMYLIKAEAMNELNQPGAITELARVHNLRNSANPVAAAPGQAMREAILKERLLEFAGEGKRRTDLIRHGKFLNQWSTTMLNGKPPRTDKPHLILFPVPQPQLASNAKLAQNPGY